ITCILMETRGRAGFLLSFFARRGLRIYPLYFVVLFVICAVLAPLVLRTRVDNYEVWRDGWLWNWLFLTNFYIASQGHWVSNITDVTWSVCIEEQFYFVWPFVVMWLSRRPLLWFTGAMVVGAVVVRWWVLRVGG